MLDRCHAGLVRSLNWRSGAWWLSSVGLLWLILVGGIFSAAAAAASNENYGTSNSSVRTLLDSGREQMVDQQLEAAALTIERARRIEPDNPVIWHQLARIRYQLKSWDEAFTLSQKSLNLAGDQYPVLIQRNRNLQLAVQQARQGEIWTLAEIDMMQQDDVADSIVTMPIVDGAIDDSANQVPQIASPGALNVNESGEVSTDLSNEASVPQTIQQPDATRLTSARQNVDNPAARQQVQQQRPVTPVQVVVHDSPTRTRTLTQQTQASLRQPTQGQPGQSKEATRTPGDGNQSFVAPISEPRTHSQQGNNAIADSTTQNRAPGEKLSAVVDRSFLLGHQQGDHAIPQNAMPAPGYCRVWYDNLLLANQPPIVQCNEIGNTIPNGARIIVGRYR